MSEEKKAVAYYLSAPRYLQQFGQNGPEYVAAAPGRPVKVLLPEGTKEDAHLKLLPQDKPKDVRPGVSVAAKPAKAGPVAVKAEK